MSMAVGEYISVSAQADTERADIATERRELAADPASELRELAGIYEGRGLDAALATKVAEQMMDHDALAAHRRDELGITEVSAARPIQAALSSAASFTVGAAAPLLAAIVADRSWRIAAIAVTALVCLAVLGVVSARAGKAPARAGGRPDHPAQHRGDGRHGADRRCSSAPSPDERHATDTDDSILMLT